MNQETTQKQPPRLHNPLAFPRPAFHPTPTTNGNWSYNNRAEDGMTLLDHYAGIAMHAYLTQADRLKGSQRDTAGAAWNMAKAMLETRPNVP